MVLFRSNKNNHLTVITVKVEYTRYSTFGSGTIITRQLTHYDSSTPTFLQDRIVSQLNIIVLAVIYIFLISTA